MPQGEIKKIVADKGYGFIQSEGEKDMFFHVSSVSEDAVFEDLAEGQVVEYEIGEGPKGPRAENVRPA